MIENVGCSFFDPPNIIGVGAFLLVRTEQDGEKDIIQDPPNIIGLGAFLRVRTEQDGEKDIIPEPYMLDARLRVYIPRFIGCATVYRLGGTCSAVFTWSIKFYRIILVWKLSLGSIRPSSEAVFYDVAEEAISSSLYLKAVCTCRFAHSRLLRNVFATFSCWLSDGGAGSNYVVCVWSLPRGTRCRTVLGY